METSTIIDMNKIHNLIEEFREAALTYDAELALTVVAGIRDRLYDLDIDLNSSDWDASVTAINNYLRVWLTKNACSRVKRTNYDRARAMLRTPDCEAEIGDWMRDIKAFVLPVMHAALDRPAKDIPWTIRCGAR